jgi:hypothetical protein
LEYRYKFNIFAYIKKIKTLALPETHISKCKYNNEIDMVDTILTVYSTIKFKGKDRLRDFEKNILIYYIRKGLTDETLEMISEDLDKKKNYLHGINKHLRDKGYLISSKTNLRKFDLNEDLKKLRDSFINKKIKLYTLVFHN